MANIKQYDSPVDTLRPTDIGVNALTMEGRRVGAFYDQAGNSIKQSADDEARAASQKAAAVGAQGQSAREIAGAVAQVGDEAVKYETHREISAGAANLATLHANLTTAWNNMANNADPNDPGVAGRFRDQMESQLQDFTEKGFLTDDAKNWAEGQIGQLRQHLYDKTSADMSTLAGHALAVNLDTLKNKLSSTVRDDPSSVDFALKTVDSTVGAMADSSPNLSFDQKAEAKTGMRQHLKEQIVQSWVDGASEKNPGAVSKAIESGKYDDFIDRAAANKIIKMNTRLRTDDGLRATEIEERRQAVGYNQDLNNLELRTAPTEPGGRPALPDDYYSKLKSIAAKYPLGAAKDSGRIGQMLSKGEALTDRLNKPEPMGQISHSTTMDMLGQIRATDDSRMQDNKPIYDAYRNGKLNSADFNFLQKEFTDARTPEGEALNSNRSLFWKRYSDTIDPSAIQTGQRTPEGQQRLYIAEQDARQQETAIRAKGGNPSDVYDPRSPSFFGAPENVAKYQRSLQEVLHAPATTAPANNAPAPKVNDRKQFKQGWGVWNGSAWVPERPDVPIR